MLTKAYRKARAFLVVVKFGTSFYILQKILRKRAIKVRSISYRLSKNVGRCKTI